MRIIYVTQRLPFGVGETFIVPEVEALLAAGHDVLVVPRRSSEPILHDDVEALVARMRRIPRGLTVAAAIAGAFAAHPTRTARVFRRIGGTRPRRRGLANAVATADGLWLARVARDWRADHIHAHWAHLTATTAMAASALSGVPWSFTAHRYDVVLNNLLDVKLRSARFGRFIARCMLDVARGMIGPEAAARAVVIHMGVRLPPRPSAAPRRAVPVVVCPARLVPFKGHRCLLDAAALVMARGVPFELRLAGDGPEAGAIAGRIRELGLEGRVHMAGTVPHAELLARYRDEAPDCVVLPSLHLGGSVHEGLSVSLIEAMAYGIPAISTTTGGQSELLGRGAGLLVPPGDVAALAGALGGVLTSADLRAQLSRDGRRRIEEEFDVDAIAAELVRRFAGQGAAAPTMAGAH